MLVPAVSVVQGMLRVLTAVAVLAVASAPAPAYPDPVGGSGPAALFSAEVFATPSYHLMEIPKVEEGGQGFAWAYLNQTPESWGRALLFWPGPTPETVFRSSTPQQGPLAGHSYRSPGAWTSYPPGGDSAGDADFGKPARFPLGPVVDTPTGRLQVLSFSGHAHANEGVGDVAFGAYEATAAPVRISFARSFASARREEGASVSSGWALARDVQIGEVGISEVRSDASVRATPSGETGSWSLTIAGVTIAGQRLEWTNQGVSLAPGSEAPLAQLNAELAKGAESFRSELQLVPGRVWRDEAGTHVQSGFLQVGHRPVVTENNPGQKLAYAFSVVSARALYRLADPYGGLGEELPAPAVEDSFPVEVPAAPAAGPAVELGPAAKTLGEDAPAVVLAPSGRLAYGDAVGVVDAGSPSPTAEPPAGAGPSVAAPAPAAGSVNGQARAGPAAVTGLGREAAGSLRDGIGLLALVGVAAGLAVLRAARRQLELIGTSREGG